MTRLSEERVFLCQELRSPTLFLIIKIDPVSGARKAGTGPQGTKGAQSGSIPLRSINS